MSSIGTTNETEMEKNLAYDIAKKNADVERQRNDTYKNINDARIAERKKNSSGLSATRNDAPNRVLMREQESNIDYSKPLTYEDYRAMGLGGSSIKERTRKTRKSRKTKKNNKKKKTNKRRR